MNVVPAQARTLRLNVADNVVVAIDGIDAGHVVVGDITALRRIPRGHKVATEAIASGQPIRKFGQIIGFAAGDIAPGDHIHTHNCEFHTFDRDYAFATEARDEAILPIGQRATFQGFRRPDGRSGTRNYLAILSSVNCSASVARFMAEAINRSGVLADSASIAIRTRL